MVDKSEVLGSESSCVGENTIPVVYKSLDFHGRLIHNIPVILLKSSFEEESISCDTITKLYELIEKNPSEKELYFK